MKNHQIFDVRAAVALLAAAIVAAVAGGAFAQSLSEGLWKEFVEGKTDEARVIYDSVANSSYEAQVVAKAKARMQAIDAGDARERAGARKAATKEPGGDKKIKYGGPFILRIDPDQALSMFVKDEQARKQFSDFLASSLADELKRLIVEDFSSRKLPTLTVMSHSGLLVPDDVDIVIESEGKITFNPLASRSSQIYGYSVTPCVLFLSKCPTAADVFRRWKEYSDFTSEDDVAAVVRFIRREFPAPFVARIGNFEEFVNGNRINFLKRDPLDDPMWCFAEVKADGGRLVIRSSGGFRFFTQTVRAIERNLKIKLDLSSIAKTDEGAKLEAADLAKLGSKFAPAFLKNYSQAREAARYKACMANLRNLGAAAELFAMETTEAKLTAPGDELVDALVKLGYLKGKPKCPEGGSYSLVKDGQTDFICSVHKAYWTKASFKLAKASGGGEKILMNPSVLVSMDQDANISVGSEREEKGDAKRGAPNVAEGLKYVSIKVHPYRENEDYGKGTVLLSIDFTFTLDLPAKSAGGAKEAEGMVNFHSTMRVREDSGEWAPIPLEAGTLKDYRLYVRCSH